MAVTSGPGGGFGINLPIHIDLSASLKELREYQAAFDAFQEKRKSVPDPGSPKWGPASAGNALEASFAWRANPQGASLKQAQNQAVAQKLQVWKVTKQWPSGLQQGQFVPYKPPAQANASPAGQPYQLSAAARSLGAINSAIGGWRQLQQGALPSKFAGIAQMSGLSGLKGVSKFFSKMQGVPSWNQFTQNQTSNTSYLGSVAGGAMHHATNFVNAVEAAKAAKGEIPLAGAVAGAAAVYKGTELAAKTTLLATAYALKSGREAIKTGLGRMANDAASIFDYINNYVPALQQGYKMTAKFDDAVAQVTGKLPDTFFYAPQFHRIAQANLQFEAMVKRNLAMTKAGAMGNSDARDQVRDTFFNAAMQQ